MAVLRRANALSVASKMVSDLYALVQVKLRKYCTDRVKELGLVAKTFPHEFNLGHDVVESRKTIGKLKTLLLRHVVKVIPFVTFASNEFLEVHERDSILVNVTVTETRDTLDMGTYDWQALTGSVPSMYGVATSESHKQMYLSVDPSHKWLKRYARYLNYIFRKNHVPLRATADTKMVFDRDDLAAARAMPVNERQAAKIKYNILVRLRFDFVKWRCSQLDRYKAVVEEGKVDDNLFADATKWQNSGPYIGLNPNQAQEFYRYTVEKLFLHLDKGVNILTTLTRKVRYGSPAFSFRDC